MVVLVVGQRVKFNWDRYPCTFMFRSDIAYRSEVRFVTRTYPGGKFELSSSYSRWVAGSWLPTEENSPW